MAEDCLACTCTAAGTGSLDADIAPTDDVRMTAQLQALAFISAALPVDCASPGDQNRRRTTALEGSARGTEGDRPLPFSPSGHDEDRLHEEPQQGQDGHVQRLSMAARQGDTAGLQAGVTFNMFDRLDPQALSGSPGQQAQKATNSSKCAAERCWAVLRLACAPASPVVVRLRALQAVRLLLARASQEGHAWSYPSHLTALALVAAVAPGLAGFVHNAMRSDFATDLGAVGVQVWCARLAITTYCCILPALTSWLPRLTCTFIAGTRHACRCRELAFYI